MVRGMRALFFVVAAAAQVLRLARVLVLEAQISGLRFLGTCPAYTVHKFIMKALRAPSFVVQVFRKLFF